MRYFLNKKDGQFPSGGKFYRWVDDTLKGLEDGSYVVSITKAKRKRSLDQNALFHMWCGLLEKEYGQPAIDFKDYFKTRFLARENTLGGGLIVGGTSDLRVKEFTHFLQQVHAEAAQEFSYDLPLPENDKAWEAYINGL